MKAVLHPKTQERIHHYGSMREVLIQSRYSPKNQRFRGVWVSTVHNIDLPVCTDVSSYRQQLINIVETASEYHMNKIIFQIRPAGDAFYQSIKNPWSRFLSGTEGKDPGFDPLALLIQEASKKGIAIHAWMNPYRISTMELSKLGMEKHQYLESLDANNFARCHPDETILDGVGKIILKPASPLVRKHVEETIMEVIEHYDIEAVHIDDYFYPYAKVPMTEEEADYESNKKPLESFEDWRRRNVNLLIEAVSKRIKTLNQETGRSVEFGISPFALFRTNKRLLETGWENGSNNHPGILQCYDDLYSDIVLWMEQKWIDYVVPQAYFPFAHEKLPYADVVEWWATIARKTKTKLYIGQAFYLVGSNDLWMDPLEIKRQFLFNQRFSNIGGTIFFTYKNFLKTNNQTLSKTQQILKECWKHL